jgi:predicted RNA-binding Zn-ribbon protein involved in translation (DUF1610 family)
MPDKIYKACVSCGVQFYINERDQRFFASQVDPRTGNQLELPKRCFSCRKKRERQRAQGLKPSNVFTPEVNTTEEE